MELTSLPIDIIILLFPYLNAKEFLAFTSCHPAFLSLRQEPSFWRGLTRSTFRIPPQPLLEGDGAHWQRLYKDLKTQTRVFTWGSNTRGNLGQWRQPGRRRRHYIRPRGTSGWPHEMVDLDQVGVVADVQCGGWSTVILNSRGELWACGVLNGMSIIRNDTPLRRLAFAPAYPPSTSSRYEPSTAVKQVSVGRYRIVALSDDYKVWEWSDFTRPAQIVKFFNLDNDPARGRNGKGKVTKVVAGWTKSSAYVQGHGIVYWSAQPGNEAEEAVDAMIVEHEIVPGTAFRRKHPQLVAKNSTDAQIGEVTDYIFLEGYIVFVTHLQKLFAYFTDSQVASVTPPVELTNFYKNSAPCINRLTGSFQRFGVFTTDGTVLIGNRKMLDMAWNSHVNSFELVIPNPEIIPALQHSSVISLAFGDYHFHALHADGSITSYGADSQTCGSLGLGDHNISHLRGVYSARRGTDDGELRTPSWGDGRRTIWFEEEKQQWLIESCQKGATNEANPRFLRAAEDPETTELVGEWFEREGRDWSKGPNGDQIDEHEDGVAPYFALNVSAAGHSSAAVVLVNEEKAAKIRKKYVTKEPTPKGEEKNQGESSQTLLGSVSENVGYLTQWLLGRPSNASGQNSNLQEAEEEEERDPEEIRRAKAEEIRYGSTYVWDQQPFPRLRYPSGELMPGEVSPTKWKGGEPDFEELRRRGWNFPP